MTSASSTWRFVREHSLSGIPSKNQVSTDALDALRAWQEQDTRRLYEVIEGGRVRRNARQKIHWKLVEQPVQRLREAVVPEPPRSVSVPQKSPKAKPAHMHIDQPVWPDTRKGKSGPRHGA